MTRIAVLQAHIDHLCASHGIIADYSSRRRILAVRRTRYIRINPITTAWRYAGALHEIGHILGPRQNGRRIEQELGAWEYVLAESQVPFTSATYRRIHRCLTSYLVRAQRRRNMWAPPAGHDFHRLMDSLAELGNMVACAGMVPPAPAVREAVRPPPPAVRRPLWRLRR